MNSLTNQFQGGQDMSLNSQAAQSREMAEVQSQIFLAKQFPRNEYQAEIKILNACKRKSLAETALYQYPRGSMTVTGPSIRLAETIAQYWGNINFGIKELEQKNGESTVVAYAWDMETNTRQEKVFQVKHERYAKGKMTKLTDPRDIYELAANNGARRLRACILGVIPGDIIDNAVAQCNQTLQSSYEEPLKDRVVSVLRYFQKEYGINQEMVEAKLGHSMESFTEQDYITLKSINQSLKDGMAKREDFFKIIQSKEAPKTSLEAQFKEGEKDVANQG
ncbi:hypothetical protein ABE28_008805 [Peribacillus muralis]|uniref:Uncharacterized protein n=1 Tax=Peribacillus muralis TaxID=264697 RepID=A0A1B3XMM7_9BACI|nr:hypothetical protein [Peribacillus muralis]AOH54450.1 hypothetical protein ABE28_008805 [Peribacillus muralis]